MTVYTFPAALLTTPPRVAFVGASDEYRRGRIEFALKNKVQR